MQIYADSGTTDALFSVLSGFIGAAAALGGVWLSEQFQRRRERESRRVSRAQESVHQFYEPLMALLETNRVAFESFSPTRQVEQSAANTKRWDIVVDEIILANNDRILSTLLDRPGHLAPTDSLTAYTPLIMHIISYRTFRKGTFEGHRLFLFPTQITSHVQGHLEELRKTINPSESAHNVKLVASHTTTR